MAGGDGPGAAGARGEDEAGDGCAGRGGGAGVEGQVRVEDAAGCWEVGGLGLGFGGHFGAVGWWWDWLMGGR